MEMLYIGWEWAFSANHIYRYTHTQIYKKYKQF